MDDDLEDKIFYQVYIFHTKIMSKIVFGFPPSALYFWRWPNFNAMRSELIVFGLFIGLLLLYYQIFQFWTFDFLKFIRTTNGFRTRHTKKQMTGIVSTAEGHSWDEILNASAVYAVQGRRPKMEDRFFLEENINRTGISMFAIFDGHGGEFAAEFAKNVLVKNIYNKVLETSSLRDGHSTDELKYYQKIECDATSNVTEDLKSNPPNLVKRKKSLRKSHSEEQDLEDIKDNHVKEDVFLNKLNSVLRTKSNFLRANNDVVVVPETHDAKFYINKGNINFGKILSDEVLSADYKLIALAKKMSNVAGTTAIIAIIEKSKLIVANAGDSRGVMCDRKGNAIPLSFDHKPQQVRERKRIEDAGGFIEFKGVWRVAGILATSRAMGDYPLKDKKLVIADPDILTFDLADHRPMFLVFASDGLWDIFTNEEAIIYIKQRLHEPHFGAKSITLEAFYRGSVDNITVMIIIFRNGSYEIKSFSA